MPKKKDLDRVVRTRMQKTPDYAALSGVSDSAILKATGRTWLEWVDLLDGFGAASKPHREIVAHVYSLGRVSGWWSQSVTVGYERIRGLRERGQRRDGAWEANKSRTFAVPVATLFEWFDSPRKRRRWLDAKITVRRSTPPKYIKVTWPDGTSVDVGFVAKGEQKSVVSVQHTKIASKEDAQKLRQYWTERFDALGELIER